MRGRVLKSEGHGRSTRATGDDDFAMLLVGASMPMHGKSALEHLPMCATKTSLHPLSCFMS